jgi:hypothetical protein
MENFVVTFKYRIIKMEWDIELKQNRFVELHFKQSWISINGVGNCTPTDRSKVGAFIVTFRARTIYLEWDMELEQKWFVELHFKETWISIQEATRQCIINLMRRINSKKKLW